MKREREREKLNLLTWMNRATFLDIINTEEAACRKYLKQIFSSDKIIHKRDFSSYQRKYYIIILSMPSSCNFFIKSKT